MGDIQFIAEGNGSVPGGSRGLSTTVDFPLPWLDYATTAIPNSLTLVLRWAEFLWNSQGTYRQACQRTVRYFITEPVITGVEDDKAKDIRDVLEHYLKIKSFLSECGDNYIQYGNLFLVRHIPFKRSLSCKCGYLVAFEKAEGMYRWEDFSFKKTGKGCPSCGSQDTWDISDSQSKDPKDVRFILLSPHEVEIAWNPYTKSKMFYWNLPPHLTEGIRKGVVIMLRETPEELIKTAKGSKRLVLDDSAVFHAAEPASCGLYTGGWGLPRVISNFRLAYHHQTLARLDMAIAMDYINGMRVISPDNSTNGNGAGDPLLALGGTAFNSMISSMVATHRRDPASWQISAFPVKYQLFGGEGQQLSPKDLLKMKLDEWLDATGIPAELYHGTLSVQAAPMALRIFENSWPEISALYNNVLEWISSYLTEVMELPDFRVEMEAPHLVDDMERRGLMLQLMGGNQVAPQTALRLMGIKDPREEIVKSFEWQAMSAEENKKFQDKMQQLQDADMVHQNMAQQSQQSLNPAPMDPSQMGPGGGGAPSGGGAPGGGPIQVGDTTSPEGMDSEGDRIARQLLTMDPASRRRQLADLKKSNESLWAIVKGKLQDLEQDAKSQGVQAMRQGQIQPSQGGPPGQGPPQGGQQ